MSEQYLIVNTKILPDFYEKVVAARDLVEQHKVKGVSEAVQRVGISRSTYYKYKDSIFSFSENARGRKAVLSMILTHQQGVLSEVSQRAGCSAYQRSDNQPVDPYPRSCLRQPLSGYLGSGLFH